MEQLDPLPPPYFNDAKMSRFYSFVPLFVPFYSFEDCSPSQGYPQHLTTPLYPWVETGTLRVNSVVFSQEHNRMSVARARSGVECSNHKQWRTV